MRLHPTGKFDNSARAYGHIEVRPLAAAMGTSEGATKVAVHRLRRRFRDLLIEEVGETVLDRRDIDDEMRYLLAAVSGTSR